jgi:hypothetical protein
LCRQQCPAVCGAVFAWVCSHLLCSSGLALTCALLGHVFVQHVVLAPFYSPTNGAHLCSRLAACQLSLIVQHNTWLWHSAVTTWLGALCEGMHCVRAWRSRDVHSMNR